MAKYDLVLFDMDGTIVDSDEMLFHSLFDLYDKYNGGKRKPKEELIKYSGPPIEDSLRIEFPHVEHKVIVDEYIKASAYYSPIYIVPMGNIIEVCQKLKDAGIKIGIVTNKHTPNSIKTLEITHMENLFDVLIGYNQVENHKPAGDGIIKAMELTNIFDKSKVIYVGDNNIDYFTAVNAGVDSAIINWGPRASTINVNPTYKIDSFDELLEVVLWANLMM